MRRVILVGALLLIPLAGVAQPEGGGIDVVDVSGPLDAGAIEFVNRTIQAAAEQGQVLAVVQVNSKAVLDGDAMTALLSTLANPPLPVAVWVGPAPAYAYGANNLLLFITESALAPGSTVGLVEPLVLGGESGEMRIPEGFDAALPAEESGLPLQPSLRQYLQDLDGVTFPTAAGEVVVETLEEYQGGVTAKQVTFHKPGLVLRYFRLGATPEAAFLFLVVGLTVVTFEFFAIGPGVAAGVASLSLLIAGWSVVNLPVRWWALGLALLGWILLTASYQRGGVIAMTGIGAALLQIAGMYFIDGSGQLDPRWWLVLPSVLAVLFFYLLAMPTVQRARFSTQTLGRDHLIGRQGVALAAFDPDGVVEVGGARWRAMAHREAGITEDTRIEVVGVDGLYLEVEPVGSEDRENR